MPQDALTWAAAVTVAVLSVGRLTKLITEDAWPPAAFVRQKWVERFQNEWGELFICPFCMAPWVAVFVLFTGWVSDLHPVWWWFNGWLAVSYVAAIIVARDIPGGE